MRSFLLIALFGAVAGCKCGPTVAKVNPSLGVSPAGLDFGQVKVGQSKQLTVRLESQTRTAVVFSSIAVEGTGAGAYRLGTSPMQLDPLGNATMTVTFTRKPFRSGGYS